MIQRKQTLFLIAALIFAVLCLCLPIATFTTPDMGLPSTMFNLWVLTETGAYDYSVWPLFAILLLTCPLYVFAIFAYKNRMAQARLCVSIVFLLIAWYIAFAVLALTRQESANLVLTLSLPAAFPAVSIIFTIMARHGIIADEKLVRSMDRIR